MFCLLGLYIWFGLESRVSSCLLFKRNLAVHTCPVVGRGFTGGSVVKKKKKKKKNPSAMQEMQVRSLGREDPLEEETATHSSILAWRIPWTEKPGEL